jgi:hypothetical protein
LALFQHSTEDNVCMFNHERELGLLTQKKMYPYLKGVFGDGRLVVTFQCTQLIRKLKKSSWMMLLVFGYGCDIWWI